jgi:hypothetical protein
MKAFSLPAKWALVILILTASGALAAWRATASFTPTSNGGPVFAVINANRSAGATTTLISVTSGSFRTGVIRGNGYGNCAGSANGWILMVRNPAAGLFTLSTTGTIVRPPYQGVPPSEVGHSCYKIERIRVR